MLDEIVPCGHRDGSHRAIPPAETVRRVRPLAPVMGITRLADVTGLDNVGIPVVMACRPNARSLAVSQGKGTTLDAARASALMESVELFHAEHVVLPLKLGSFEELRYSHELVDVTRLARAAAVALDLHRPILWIESRELADPARGVWVPFEIVHTAYGSDDALPATRCLSMSSNGLASGNHMLEAIAHGIYELVERDATALFALATAEQRDVRRVDLESVDHPACRDLLQRFRAADVIVGVWEVTSDVPLPCFLATICDRDGASLRGLFGATGSGCHPAREVAFARALTEAAQSRLTYVSGARDDMFRSIFRASRDRDAIERLRRTLVRPGRRAFTSAPTFEGETVNAELAFARAALEQAGFAQILFVDLSRPELRIPVARTIIPGLQGNVEDGVALLGADAAARAARAFATEASA